MLPHTASTAPFSFLTSPQTSHLRSTTKNIPPIEKQKKMKEVKSLMLGPERGIDAGTSSWMFVALEEVAEDASIILLERSSGPNRLPSISKDLASSKLPLESCADGCTEAADEQQSQSCALTSILKRLFVRPVHEPVIVVQSKYKPTTRTQVLLRLNGLK
ncbi:hypothetical protein Pst134EB_004312 [Puccinia striiformis f. sp. tritici]|nr:hypothetical protein Pst134EB_004312 [Puccinia striiformis f. sp. tritici]